MKLIKQSKQFRKDYKKLKKSWNKDIKKLNNILWQIIDWEKLEFKHKNHKLKWKWENCYDCHIEWDWVLVYEKYINEDWNKIIIFHTTDNHSNLFW